MDHEELMARAVAMSKHGIEIRAGGPFGAVIARAGEVVADGWNRVTSQNDPTAHAEVVAIREAAQSLGTQDLSGCILYTSCEPCPMCLSAAYWSRVDHVYYANTRADAAGIGFDDSELYDEVAKPIEARSLSITRLENDDAVSVMQKWAADPTNRRY
jgi:tRNA(Arg) A34 adenosine deaminase TadA